MNHWLKGYIDKNYDMIMIDETQDFDILMLRMVLDDTTIPKIFVGDPMQSIYQWRGCINGFNYLPESALIVEFYSTFRVGDPACEVIRQKFKNCWMISKAKHQTILTDNVKALEGGYTYLFRSWKKLLTTAQRTKNIWVCNFEAKSETMRKMHPGLRKGGGFDDGEDDLPKFLRTLSENELEEMISSIEDNSTSKEEAKYKFYTIHSYKGLEDDYVRIADDIDEKYGEDMNLYYVALTRGMKTIVEDTVHVDFMKYFARLI
jgi:superfamily I DNA/RNA helicase